MKICKSKADLNQQLTNPELSSSIGFTPTMGALHQGHLSLIKNAKDNQDLTVVSIFVNPSQFNEPKDFENYPVQIDEDIKLLEELDVDILFLPAVEEMYPEGINNNHNYDFGLLGTLLEGENRPGHFDGVAVIVSRLLQLVQPHNLYMGQKDYQQCLIVKSLIEQMGIETKLHICPIIREENGLAMSSRNLLLSYEEKNEATLIHKVLRFCKENAYKLSIPELQSHVQKAFKDSSFFSELEYISFNDANNLSPISIIEKGANIVISIAAKSNKVRLIDNMLLIS